MGAGPKPARSRSRDRPRRRSPAFDRPIAAAVFIDGLRGVLLGRERRHGIGRRQRAGRRGRSPGFGSRSSGLHAGLRIVASPGPSEVDGPACTGANTPATGYVESRVAARPGRDRQAAVERRPAREPTAWRRGWDSNPRGLRPTVFKTVPIDRSGTSPRGRGRSPDATALASRAAHANPFGRKGTSRRRRDRETSARTPLQSRRLGSACREMRSPVGSGRLGTREAHPYGPGRPNADDASALSGVRICHQPPRIGSGGSSLLAGPGLLRAASVRQFRRAAPHVRGGAERTRNPVS